MSRQARRCSFSWFARDRGPQLPVAYHQTRVLVYLQRRLGSPVLRAKNASIVLYRGAWPRSDSPAVIAGVGSPPDLKGV